MDARPYGFRDIDRERVDSVRDSALVGMGVKEFFRRQTDYSLPFFPAW